MKKVINITLGGIVFAIEHDAFENLETYLGQIKASLSSNEDASEVLEDVERAIAEKFIALKRSEKLAVTADDVSRVMTEMGSPSDFGDGDVSEASIEENNGEESSDDPDKRLYRDTDDAVIAGVASGLANYFKIDPVLVRLIFVVLTFFNGLGILAYIILWLVVPAAKTTADKYAMRGERVTLKEISERVRKNIEKIDSVDTEAAKGVWGRVRELLNKLFRLLGQVARYLIVAARYIVGFVFLIGGAFAIAGLVSAYCIVLLSDRAFVPPDVQIALDTMLSSGLGIVAITASFVMMVIPLLAVVLLGSGLLAKRNLFTVNKSITLAVVWIIAVVLAGTTSVLQVQRVMPLIDPEQFENGQYQININIEDDRFKVNGMTTVPVEESISSTTLENAPEQN